MRLSSEMSSVSPTQVDMTIPFLGCSLKFEAMLSMMMDLLRSRPIIERSLMLTKSSIRVCSL